MPSLSRRDVLRTTVIAGLLPAEAGILAAASNADDKPSEEASPIHDLQSAGLLLSVATPAVHRVRALHIGVTVPVVLCNLAGQSLKFWREWCSWGYYNVSIDFRDANGREWHAVKKPRGWNKNYPDAAELAPGESAVLPIVLSDTDWQDLPAWDDLLGKNLKMRVRYEVPLDEHASGNRVWAGSLRTAFQQYRVTART